MAQSQFSLSWDAHKRNVCNGLSALQQNGEFVDMTLAADGHLVKVHQVIMALASPYIKELISSAQCSHPVIFLNKISYTTLCAILEYVYTGEVLVSIENLNELVEAGRELHIKGLDDMKLHQTVSKSQRLPQSVETKSKDNLDDEICYFQISNPEDDDKHQYELKPEEYDDREMVSLNESVSDTFHNLQEDTDEVMAEITTACDKSDIMIKKEVSSNVCVMQYTISNQGSLQMILNRFVYYLKHTNRNNTRQWRCVDYLTAVKCPAYVITRDDVVVQRVAAHCHAFHDKRILKKVHARAIFSAIHEAEQLGNDKRVNVTPRLNEGNNGDTE